MWSPKPLAKPLARLGAVFAMTILLAGCFQPLYGEHTTVGGPAVADALQGVDVVIDAPNGSIESRLAVEVRNGLLFGFTGGGGGHAPTHKLDVRLTATNQSVIVDVNSGRPDMQNFGLDATYTLTELATGKVVLRSQTFSRVSYDIPGQQQRFARARGQRDAENRAAKVIADQIQSRLASYFVNGA
jgi:LPS-assembly lipoprotein